MSPLHHIKNEIMLTLVRLCFVGLPQISTNLIFRHNGYMLPRITIAPNQLILMGCEWRLFRIKSLTTSISDLLLTLSDREYMVNPQTPRIGIIVRHNILINCSRFPRSVRGFTRHKGPENESKSKTQNRCSNFPCKNLIDRGCGTNTGYLVMGGSRGGGGRGS